MSGCSLKDMEFIQFHPTGLVPSGILITEAARGEGGYLKIIRAKGLWKICCFKNGTCTKRYRSKG